MYKYKYEKIIVFIQIWKMSINVDSDILFFEILGYLNIDNLYDIRMLSRKNYGMFEKQFDILSKNKELYEWVTYIDNPKLLYKLFSQNGHLKKITLADKINWEIDNNSKFVESDTVVDYNYLMELLIRNNSSKCMNLVGENLSILTDDHILKIITQGKFKIISVLLSFETTRNSVIKHILDKLLCYIHEDLLLIPTKLTHFRESKVSNYLHNLKNCGCDINSLKIQFAKLFLNNDTQHFQDIIDLYFDI